MACLTKLKRDNAKKDYSTLSVFHTVTLGLSQSQLWSISDIVVRHDVLTELPSLITNSCSDQLSVSILQEPEDWTEGEQNACASAWQNSLLFWMQPQCTPKTYRFGELPALVVMYPPALWVVLERDLSQNPACKKKSSLIYSTAFPLPRTRAGQSLFATCLESDSGTYLKARYITALLSLPLFHCTCLYANRT